MGFKAKIQVIKRKKSEQYYINFPSAVAQAMEFKKGDEVEWIVKSRNSLTLHRVKDQEKKTTQDS